MIIEFYNIEIYFLKNKYLVYYNIISEQQFIEDTEIEAANANVEIPKKKKELSQKQIEYLINIRVKALEKKREIKLKKNKEYEIK